MRQTKAMSPDYSMAWWRENDLDPPNVDPLKFMLKRLEWRYARGTPTLCQSTAYLGDSSTVLDHITRRVRRGKQKRIQLLFASPPYFGLTNYHYDQWLRLWLLGGPPNALRTGGKDRGKFEHQENYRTLLQSVFEKAAGILARKGVVYVRTGTGEPTIDTTREVLKKVFPRHRLSAESQPFHGPTQTRLFGGKSDSGEMDFILTPN